MKLRLDENFEGTEVVKLRLVSTEKQRMLKFWIKLGRLFNFENRNRSLSNKDIDHTQQAGQVHSTYDRQPCLPLVILLQDYIPKLVGT